MDNVRERFFSLFRASSDSSVKGSEGADFPEVSNVRESAAPSKEVAWNTLFQEGLKATALLATVICAPTSFIGGTMMYVAHEKRGVGVSSLDNQITAKTQECRSKYTEIENLKKSISSLDDERKSAQFSQDTLNAVQGVREEKVHDLQAELAQAQKELQALQSKKKNIDRLELAGSILCFPVLVKDLLTEAGKKAKELLVKTEYFGKKEEKKQLDDINDNAPKLHYALLQLQEKGIHDDHFTKVAPTLNEFREQCAQLKEMHPGISFKDILKQIERTYPSSVTGVEVRNEGPPITEPLDKNLRVTQLGEKKEIAEGAVEALNAIKIVYTGTDQEPNAITARTREVDLSGNESLEGHFGITHAKVTVADDGFTTYSFQMNGRDYKVTEFEEGAYRGPRIEGFLDQLDTVYKGFTKSLIDSGKTPSPDFQKAMEALYNVKKTQLAGLQEIERSKMTQSHEKAAEYYKRRHEEAFSYIQEFIEGTVALAEGHADASNIIENVHTVIDEINENRPIVVNKFEVEGHVFADMQVPETFTEQDGERVPGPTIPTLRRNNPGLVNYVSTACMELNDRGEVIDGMSATRHSSFTGIRRKDPTERQAIAVHNARQHIMDRAYEAIKSGGLEPGHHKLPINYLFLLTPAYGDEVRNRSKVIRGKWTGEGEVMQLEDGAKALEMFDGRIIPLVVDGRPYIFEVDTTLFNFGINRYATDSAISLGIDEEQKNVNTQGMFKFAQKRQRAEVDLEGTARDLVEERNALMSSDGIRKQEEKIETIKAENKEVDNEEKKALERLYEKVLDENLDQATRDGFKDKIKETEKRIEERRSGVTKEYRKLDDMRKDLYQKNRENIEFFDQRIVEASGSMALRDVYDFERKYYTKEYLIFPKK